MVQEDQSGVVIMKKDRRGGGGGGAGGGVVPSRQLRRRRRSELYRDLVRGADDTHSAILRSMCEDGLDTRPYLEERRRAFHAGGEEAEGEEAEKDGYVSSVADAEPGVLVLVLYCIVLNCMVLYW